MYDSKNSFLAYPNKLVARSVSNVSHESTPKIVLMFPIPLSLPNSLLTSIALNCPKGLNKEMCFRIIFRFVPCESFSSETEQHTLYVSHYCKSPTPHFNADGSTVSKLFNSSMPTQLCESTEKTENKNKNCLKLHLDYKITKMLP